MDTLKVGIMSFDDYKKRTLDIAKGKYKPKKDEPKVWFQSIEAFSQVLSTKNQALLITIAKTKPRSMSELALKTDRHLSNLSRTLKTMEGYGIVYFERKPGREIAPRVHYSNVELELQLH
jgi:predicted transcriptional regulator